jgi:hypothetical protein
MRYWKPEDIFTVACPFCRAEIEFWCQHAPECLERVADGSPEAQVKDQPPQTETTS